jgi:hypothetical protein
MKGGRITQPPLTPRGAFWTISDRRCGTGTQDETDRMAEEQKPYTGGVITAKAANDYRWKRYILVAVLLGYGVLSIRDGFYRYPKDNAEARARGLDDLPHPGLDVQLNQVLGILLPPFSMLLLAWSLYSSRGKYEYDGTTLTAPNHLPVPVNAIRKIDRTKWDRKGIAYLEYQVPGTGKGGRIKLDDFIYQREPIDQMFEHIEANVVPGTVTTGPVAKAKPRPDSA